MIHCVAGPEGCNADHQLSLYRTKDIDVEDTEYWAECEMIPEYPLEIVTD